MPETTLREGRIAPAGAKTHFQTIADSIRFLCVLWQPNSKIPFEYWFEPICKVRIDRFMITIKKRDGMKDLKPLTTNQYPIAITKSHSPTTDQPRPTETNRDPPTSMVARKPCSEYDAALKRKTSNVCRAQLLIRNPERNLGLRWTQDPYPLAI